MKTLDEHNRERKKQIEKFELEPIKENAGVLCPKCGGEMHYWILGICFFTPGNGLPKTRVRCSECMYEDLMIV